MTPKTFAFRVGWFILGVFSLLFAAMLWFVSAFSWDKEERCRLRHGQFYDSYYLKEHPEHDGAHFPLSNKCNADYEMVEAWVNPTVVGLVLLGLGTTVVLPIRDATQYVQRRRQSGSPAEVTR